MTADQVLPILTLLVPTLALGYTALQYDRTRRWRAGDLASQLFSQLTTDDELAFACQAIDWGTGPLMVPLRYQSLLQTKPVDDGYISPQELGKIAAHETSVLFVAMRVQLSFDCDREPLGLIYRYCFDKLFSHLANVNRLLESGQIAIEHLQPFTYWLRRIAVYEYPPEGKSGKKMFQPFIRFPEFGYQGIIALGKRLGVNTWETCDPPVSGHLSGAP